MWGFCGITGLLCLLLVVMWCIAYFRSQFGPIFCADCGKDWVAGLINIRVHQLLVLAAGTTLALILAKLLAVSLQLAYLTWRMKQLTRKVDTMVLHKTEKRGVMDTLLQTASRMTSQPILENEVTAPLCSSRGSRKGPKVLICQASVGAGHKRAAEAIEEAFRQEYPEVEVKTIDLMSPEIADRIFIHYYKDWYLKLVSGDSIYGDLGNLCVGFFFDKSNHVSEGTLTGGGFLNNRRLCMAVTLNFLELVCDFEPDLMIHTHFFAPEIIAGLRRHHEGFFMPHVTVITDMDVHAWWYQEPCEKYFVPRDLCAYQLRYYGVSKERLKVSGIPIMPAFADMLKSIEGLTALQKRSRFQENMDIEVDLWESSADNRPIILVMSTGSGVVDLFRNLLKLTTGAIICVVCGRQADVRSLLEKEPIPAQHRACFLGFTKTMHELMGVADVVVTKPGGLITSEGLACGLMFVIVDPYAGQEERNAAMLLEAGVGIQVHTYSVIAYRLDPILANQAELDRYKRNSKALGLPDAARNVVRCMIEDGILEIDGFKSPRDTEKGLGSARNANRRDRSESGVSASPLHWFDVADAQPGYSRKRNGLATVKSTGSLRSDSDDM